MTVNTVPTPSECGIIGTSVPPQEVTCLRQPATNMPQGNAGEVLESQQGLLGICPRGCSGGSVQVGGMGEVGSSGEVMAEQDRVKGSPASARHPSLCSELKHCPSCLQVESKPCPGVQAAWIPMSEFSSSRKA